MNHEVIAFVSGCVITAVLISAISYIRSLAADAEAWGSELRGWTPDRVEKANDRGIYNPGYIDRSAWRGLEDTGVRIRRPYDQDQESKGDRG